MSEKKVLSGGDPRMSRAWDPQSITDLVGNLVQCGEQLSTNRGEFLQTWQMVQSQLDWKNEPSARWVERAVGPVEPEGAKLPLVRLMWNLEPIYRKGQPDHRQAMQTLGEAAWDLLAELEQIGTVIPGW
ncbi:MAG: hypothetical protein ACRC33_27345, partial [Gemmataceae bacterium]